VSFFSKNKQSKII